MTVYLIREDKSCETYNNVIEWDTTYVLYQAGRGRCKMYAGENEYFTDQLPMVKPEVENE